MPRTSSVAHRLIFQVTTNITPVLAKADATEPEPPTTTETELVVLLADDWQSSREGSSENIVDVDAGRHHAIDHEARTIHSQALWAVVGFREAEVANRMMLQSVIEAGGASIGTRADAEASLGIEAMPAEDPGFRQGMLRRSHWTLGHTHVATHKPSRHPIPSRLLRRWLAHEVMLHPRLAEHVAQAGCAPAKLYHRVRLIGEIHERTLTLLSADQVTYDREASIRGFSPVPGVDEVHARVLDLLANPPADLPDRTAMGYAALEEGDNLRALLWFLSATLAHAEQDPSGVQAINDRIDDRDLARGFQLAMLSIESGQHVEQALQLYDVVEQRAGSLGYIVGVLRANALTALAHQEEDQDRRAELLERARAGLARAVEADPGLAGAYKDLGEFYMQDFAYAATWDLWDLGRRLAPGHKIFSQIEEYEQHLEDEYPEFF